MQVSSREISSKTADSLEIKPFDTTEAKVEHQRRLAALHTGGADTLEDGGSCATPFRDPQQQFVLVNMSNSGLRPANADPAFRVLGVFQTQHCCTRHAQYLIENDPGMKLCNIHMITVHAFYCIPHSSETSIVDLQEKIAQNLVQHTKLLQAHTTEFKEHHDQLTRGLSPTTVTTSDISGKNTDVVEAQRRIDANKEKYNGMGCKDTGIAETKQDSDDGAVEESTTSAVSAKEVRTVQDKTSVETPDKTPDARNLEDKLTATHDSANHMSRTCERRGQNYVSVVLLKDHIGANSEPAINILAAFDSEEECIRYNKYVVAKHITEHDIYVKRMYEWIFPNIAFTSTDILDNVEQVYRNEELDKIMRSMRKQKTEVQGFEQHFAEEQMEVPAIEVEQDLTTAAPRVYNPPCGFISDTNKL